MTARVRAAGALAAFGYLLLVLLTRAGLPGAPRPLYDGFAPPAPYRWVNPPAALRNTNQRPTAGTGHVDKKDKEAALAFQTSDNQATVTADSAALGLTGTETGADGRLEPLDPTTFGALPAGQAPSGNVYHLTVTAVPGGRAITAFARPVSVSLEIANSAGTDLYTSPDGRTWTKTEAANAQPYVAANVRAPGYFVLGGPAGLLPTIEPARKPSRGRPLALWLGAAAALVLTTGVALALRRTGAQGTER